jgi:hypothetical protein
LFFASGIIQNYLTVPNEIKARGVGGGVEVWRRPAACAQGFSLRRKGVAMPEPTPVRLRRSRAKGARLVSPNGLPVVCVTRGTKWGNPFSVWQHADVRVGTPAEAVHLFRLLVTGDAGLLARYPFLRGRYAEIATSIDSLLGKNLACFCKPGEPCHADVLLELANAPAEVRA